MEDDRESEADDEREREPASTSRSVTQALSAEQRAVVPQGLRDVARRRDEERLDVQRVGDPVPLRGELPESDEQRDQRQRRKPAAHLATPAAAPRAPALARAVNCGAVTVSVRGSARGAGDASSATARPGRGDRTTTRSQR